MVRENIDMGGFKITTFSNKNKYADEYYKAYRELQNAESKLHKARKGKGGAANNAELVKKCRHLETKTFRIDGIAIIQNPFSIEHLKNIY